MSFPNDANGELLALMQGEGVDLSQSHMLDFYLLFGSETQGKLTAEVATTEFEGAGIFLNLDEESNKWELRVCLEMVPSHEALTDIEQRLTTIAKPFKGKYDGWGMLEPEDEIEDEA